MNLGKLVTKFRFFLAGAGVFVLVMAGVGYMVYASITRYAAEKAGFAQALAERTALQSRNPFPSEDNIRIEQENQRILKDKFDGLMESLGAGQFEVKSTEPTVFMRNLEGARRRMKQQLDDAGVVLPANFQYGFEKYVGGALPQEGDVPKLTYQLHVVEVLCRMLADAKAAELLEVSREVFETDAAPVGRPRGGQPPPGAPTSKPADAPAGDTLFSRMTFRFRFRAIEPSLVTVLNNMASNQLFMCVSNFKVRNPKETKDAIGRDYRPISEAQEKPVTPAPDIPTRDKRLILGREELIVEMDVRVYRFAGREKKAEEGRPTPARGGRDTPAAASDSAPVAAPEPGSAPVAAPAVPAAAEPPVANPPPGPDSRPLGDKVKNPVQAPDAPQASAPAPAASPL
jgi:hypothetical protein